MARLRRRRADVFHFQWLPLPQFDRHLLPKVRPARLHRARPAAAAHGRQARSLARAPAPLRRRRRPLRARARDAGRAGRGARSGCTSSRTRSSAATRRAPTTDRRCSAWHDPAVQGTRRRDRGDEAARGRASARRRRLDGADRALPRAGRRARPSSASAGSTRPRSTAPSARRPWRSSPTGPSSTSRAPSCARSVPACRRSSTTSAAWPSPCAGSAPAPPFPPGDVEAMTEAVRELLDDPNALARARKGALAARDALSWDVAAASHLAVYESLIGR